jgi:hypothetical protein
MAAIAFRRDGLALAAFSHLSSYVYVWTAARVVARMSASTTTSAFASSSVELQPGAHNLLSVDTEPQRIMDAIRYGLLAVPSAQYMPSMGTPIRGLVTGHYPVGTAVRCVQLYSKKLETLGVPQTNFVCSI